MMKVNEARGRLAQPRDRHRMRRRREWNGLSLDVVAAEAGVEQSWLSRAERGLRPMTREQVAQINAAIDRLIERRERAGRRRP